MQPSGLIFLVIIAIWAAFLLQHWVARRDHLATARSVDRFSEAMRVLERRTPLREPDLSLPPPRSYSVSPARPSREVMEKPVRSPAQDLRSGPAAVLYSPRGSRSKAGVLARRIRGLSLLALLSLVLVVPTLAAFSVLPWWSAVVVAAALVLDFTWLRHAAVAERGKRQDNARVRPANVQVRPANSRVRTVHPSVGPVARPDSRPTPQSGPVAAAPAVATAEIAGPAESGVVTVVEADLSGWAPVPVPPPTYTLKAMAVRPEPVPATVVEPPTPQPSSFDGLVDEGELDGLLDRRRAAGA